MGADILGKRFGKDCKADGARDPRYEPQLARDYDGVCYILVDDRGEPVSDYNTDLDVLKSIRAGDPVLAGCRIVMGGFRVFVEEPQIVDDPKAGHYGHRVPYEARRAS